MLRVRQLGEFSRPSYLPGGGAEDFEIVQVSRGLSRPTGRYSTLKRSNFVNFESFTFLDFRRQTI